MSIVRSVRRAGAWMLATVLAVSLLGGCATGPDALRKQRDSGLKDGDFLAALTHSRALYEAGASSAPDLAAHCGLVFAIGDYGQARDCVKRLLERVDASEASIEADLEQGYRFALEEQASRNRLKVAYLDPYDPNAFAKGRLKPGWRQTRFGIEAQLALDNVRWRARYLQGMVALQTGDPEGAARELGGARELVTHRRGEGEAALSLLELLEGRQRWRYQDMRDAGSADARAWWVDLLSALAIARQSSGDASGAQAAIEELQRTTVPRALAGYKRSREAFAYLSAGRLGEAQASIDADPEIERQHLRTGGALLGGGLLVVTLVVVSGMLAAPAAGLAAAMSQVFTAIAYLLIGVSASVLTFTVTRVAGRDTVWDLTQRWYAAATISRRNGHLEKADAMYGKLLEQEGALRSQPGIQWQVYADVAERREELGRTDEAIAFYEKAVAVIEATRRNIATESARIGFVADKQRVYQRLMRLRLQRGEVDKAFELSEQARARALLDVLAARDWAFEAAPAGAGTGTGIEGDLPARWLHEIDAREGELRLALLQDKPAEAERRRGALVQLGQRLQAQDPQLAALAGVPHYRLADIRAQLAPGEVLVSFVPAGDRIVAFALSRERLVHWDMAAGEVTGRVGLLRHAIEQRSVSEPLLRGLSQALWSGLPQLGPFEQLSIVPTGPLHALPFATLQAEGGMLPASAAVRVLPSASMLPLLQQRPRPTLPMRIMAFGNPDFGGELPALPSTELEARHVAAIVGRGQALLGREASKQALLQHAAEPSVLHIATHGQFDSLHPLQSALFLSDGRGGMAAVTASEFYGLHLGARLVTLSACETALGAVKSGDEVIGLYRALMYAGADAIVASLWQVDDDSTAYLMTRFYGHLQAMPAAQALRQAQRDTAARWPDPYHWAGFSLIGVNPALGAPSGLPLSPPPPSGAAPAR